MGKYIKYSQAKNAVYETCRSVIVHSWGDLLALFSNPKLAGNHNNFEKEAEDTYPLLLKKTKQNKFLKCSTGSMVLNIFFFLSTPCSHAKPDTDFDIIDAV